MDDKTLDNSTAVELDFWKLLGVIWHKVWIIILVSILGSVLAFLFTHYLVTPQYESSAMFYVNNNSLSMGDTSFSITSSDITASKSLVDSYIVILNARSTLNDVIDYAGVNRNFSELKKMVSAASVNSTEIFQVVVTSPDPMEAEKLASAISYILPKRISSIIEGTSAQIVDTAVVPSSPSSPSYVQNVTIGFLLSAVISVLFIVIRLIMDVTIRDEDDVSQICRYPVLSAVPDMSAPSKGKYYYDAESKHKKKSKLGKVAALSSDRKTVLVGKDISFAASEAYKLLRTKMQFSFADDNDCHVIGVSSALTGEGKSLTTVNLAYSLAQLDKRVLLIDGDLRRPTIFTKLNVTKLPGLSNYLTRQTQLQDVIQACSLDENTQIHVVSSGRIPPNPIELLSSTRMSKAIELLRRSYDFILIDLPPVSEVSDALAVAKITDGILLVVRQDHCNRNILNSTVRQFEFINARILGIVYNCASENTGKYGKKYSKKYYRKYGYGRSYADIKTGDGDEG